MTVTRIVANLAADDPRSLRAFYEEVLELELAMDHGWILTFAAPEAPGRPQLSAASEGGSDAPVPVLSIEVDDLDGVLDRARRGGHPVVYGPVDEPWGVRRAFVRDPGGRLLNILTHAPPAASADPSA